MKNLKLLGLSIVLIVAISTPAAASYESTTANPAAAVADALLVRPIMLGVSLVTTSVYLATVPLTFLMNTDEEAGCVLVRAPWWYTSGRDLGRFDEGYEHP